MKSAASGLLKKFEAKYRLVASEIKTKTQKEALQQLLQEGRVIHARAYYLAGHEPTIETERKRVLQQLLLRPRLFKQGSLSPKHKENQSYFRHALSELIDRKEVIKIGIVGDAGTELFIHRDHLVRLLGHESAVIPSDIKTSEVDADPTQKITSRIRQAYSQVTREKGRRSIFISDLLRVCGLSWEELRGWIEKEVLQAGHGQLDEGDWSAATEDQRATAVDLWGRKRLYITLA
jgi:hypothetical protein